MQVRIINLLMCFFPTRSGTDAVNSLIKDNSIMSVNHVYKYEDKFLHTRIFTVEKVSFAGPFYKSTSNTYIDRFGLLKCAMQYCTSAGFNTIREIFLYANFNIIDLHPQTNEVGVHSDGKNKRRHEQFAHLHDVKNLRMCVMICVARNESNGCAFFSLLTLEVESVRNTCSAEFLHIN